MNRLFYCPGVLKGTHCTNVWSAPGTPTFMPRPGFPTPLHRCVGTPVISLKIRCGRSRARTATTEPSAYEISFVYGAIEEMYHVCPSSLNSSRPTANACGELLAALREKMRNRGESA